jgi:hypothetical protein
LSSSQFKGPTKSPSLVLRVSAVMSSVCKSKTGANVTEGAKKNTVEISKKINTSKHHTFLLFTQQQFSTTKKAQKGKSSPFSQKPS